MVLRKPLRSAGGRDRERERERGGSFGTRRVAVCELKHFLSAWGLGRDDQAPEHREGSVKERGWWFGEEGLVDRGPRASRNLGPWV